MKREPPIDYVRSGAVSLPIRRDPVTMLVQDPNAPRREGEPAPKIEKTYESFYVDARSAGRGRLRAPTVAEAHKIREPLAKELAKEGTTAIKLSPEDKRIYVFARNTLAPHHLAVEDGARQLASILQRLNGEMFEKVMHTYENAKQKLILGAKTPEIYDFYLFDQKVIRDNGKYIHQDRRVWFIPRKILETLTQHGPRRRIEPAKVTPRVAPVIPSTQDGMSQ